MIRRSVVVQSAFFATIFLAACAVDPTASERTSSSLAPVTDDDGHGHACSNESDEHDEDADNGNDAAAEAEAAKPVRWQDGNKHDRQVPIKLLALNDFHGQITKTKKFNGRFAGGAGVLGAYLQAAQAGKQDHTIIAHAGDFVGASVPESGLLADEPALMFANLFANEYCRGDVAQGRENANGDGENKRCNMVGTLGNHEFDKGREELFRKLYGGNASNGPFLVDPWPGVRFPYVCANAVDTATGKTILPPYEIKEINGVKIAFIGAVTSTTPSVVTPAGIAGLTFLDEATAINSYVPELQRKHVHAIVVLIHEGGAQNFSASSIAPIGSVSGRITQIIPNLDDDIDVVLSGHSHKFTNALMANRNGKAILVTQAFSYSQAYADVDLVIDSDTDEVVSKSAKITVAYADAGPGLTPWQPAVDIVNAASALVAPLVNRVVGYTSVNLNRTQSAAGEENLGDVIADAQRLAMPGTQFAFMNPGGIRADIPSGAITWGELYSTQPFANGLVQMHVTGAQIYTLLEEQWQGQPLGGTKMLQISGLSYKWNPGAPVGSRIVAVYANGGVMPRDAQSYTIVVNSFLSTGGDNFVVLKQGTGLVNGEVDLEALVTFVGNHPQSAPITQMIEGRALQGTTP